MAAPADDEHECIERSRRGDQAAFGALVRTHQRMVHALTYRMTGSLADADDLAQEAFVRAFDQLSSYRGDAKFSSWLYRIAVHACLNWRQREQRRAEVYAAWSTSSLDNDSNSAPSKDSEDTGARIIQAALLKLPAKQRAAIVLTVYDGLNHAEAARTLGCSETTVSWRVFAARAKLKRWLTSHRQSTHE